MAFALLTPTAAAASSPDGASSGDATAAAACWYATYAPKKEGSRIVGWGEKWNCGEPLRWTITLQRHRGGTWWQQEGINFHTGAGWVSVSGGCVSGTWTYRTILTSAEGHQTVSATARLSC